MHNPVGRLIFLGQTLHTFQSVLCFVLLSKVLLKPPHALAELKYELRGDSSSVTHFWCCDLDHRPRLWKLNASLWSMYSPFSVIFRLCLWHLHVILNDMFHPGRSRMKPSRHRTKDSQINTFSSYVLGSWGKWTKGCGSFLCVLDVIAFFFK